MPDIIAINNFYFSVYWILLISIVFVSIFFINITSYFLNFSRALLKV